MIADHIIDIARGQARSQGVPLDLVLGVIDTESSGDTWAWNPEANWRYFWDFEAGRPFRQVTAKELGDEYPPSDFSGPRGVDPDAEWWGQQASWGLMQVMGAVAREIGFTGRFLSELCDPAIGVWAGTIVLRRHLTRWRDQDLAVSAYNAGSPRVVPGSSALANQSYVDKVSAAAKVWQNAGVA